MDVYPHMVINDDLDVCYDAFQPMLGPVYDTSIVRSHTSDAAAPSVAHDHEHALAGMFPKQCLGILPGPTDRYIESRHLCPETCSSQPRSSRSSRTVSDILPGIFANLLCTSSSPTRDPEVVDNNCTRGACCCFLSAKKSMKSITSAISCGSRCLSLSRT